MAALLRGLHEPPAGSPTTTTTTTAGASDEALSLQLEKQYMALHLPHGHMYTWHLNAWKGRGTAAPSGLLCAAGPYHGSINSIQDLIQCFDRISRFNFGQHLYEGSQSAADGNGIVKPTQQQAGSVDNCQMLLCTTINTTNTSQDVVSTNSGQHR
jgi:hypothetical protein